MTTRAAWDRCPGLLRPHIADDGAVVRLRLPGGGVRLSVLLDLLAVGTDAGAPFLQLTSRGNLQLRALPDPLPDAVMTRIEATGLLPSASHERARNILASPLAADLASIVSELDEAICADAALVELPGRFLFAVADSSGSVLSEPYDIAYQVTSDSHGVLLSGGRGIPVDRARAVGAMLDRARLFLAHRPSERCWNIRDLPAGSRVLEGLEPVSTRVAPPLGPGIVGQDLVAGVPLGLLTRGHVEALAQVVDTVVVTPWRSVVVNGGATAGPLLQDAGLIVRANTPWARLSACIGAPSCHRSATPTLPIAHLLTPLLPVAGPRIHLSGCDRLCGRPAQEYLSVVGATDAADAMAQIGATT